MKTAVAALLALTLIAGCAARAQEPAASAAAQPRSAPAAAQAAAAQPTAEGARAFVTRAEEQLAQMSEFQGRAEWVNATYITHDTDELAARVGAQGTKLRVDLAKEAARFDRVAGVDPVTRRKLNFIKQGITLPAPSGVGAADELATITTRMQSAYGKGTGTYRGEVKTGNELENLMGTVRDPKLLQEMWTSWHGVGRGMRQDYVRMVEIANEGAKELGYEDVGTLWRMKYDMSPQEFVQMVDTAWNEVRPLYEQLHCYTRAELNEEYGDGVQPATGPIRADLLGNMWGQEWGNIYEVVAPPGAGDLGYNVGDLLKAKGYDATRIARTGEGFFSSLGFAPLPATFWERSMLTKPEGRDVICHASAWNIDNVDDLRVKMCTNVTADDFVTMHHELGHNYYQRAYNQQPFLFKDSANDGFHEALGDFVALSVTPDYLVQIGLLPKNQVPDASKDVGLLLREAMDKVAFLPFGLLVDKWRWGVFNGEITPAQYNQAWTDLRLQYQGITPPVPRSEADFDPGAKFHIPGNTPYMRYFLARLLQFQFHQAACEMAGWQGPLHRCTIYGNKEVGQRLQRMLAMGQSQPWPDALEAFTGQRDISGKAMLAYFQPLVSWLEQQNQGGQCGW